MLLHSVTYSFCDAAEQLMGEVQNYDHSLHQQYPTCFDRGPTLHTAFVVWQIDTVVYV